MHMVTATVLSAVNSLINSQLFEAVGMGMVHTCPQGPWSLQQGWHSSEAAAETVAARQQDWRCFAAVAETAYLLLPTTHCSRPDLPDCARHA